jgi:chemotaxis protein MotD
MFRSQQAAAPASPVETVVRAEARSAAPPGLAAAAETLSPARPQTADAAAVAPRTEPAAAADRPRDGDAGPLLMPSAAAAPVSGDTSRFPIETLPPIAARPEAAPTRAATAAAGDITPPAGAGQAHAERADLPGGVHKGTNPTRNESTLSAQEVDSISVLPPAIPPPVGGRELPANPRVPGNPPAENDNTGSPAFEAVVNADGLETEEGEPLAPVVAVRISLTPDAPAVEAVAPPDAAGTEAASFIPIVQASEPRTGIDLPDVQDTGIAPRPPAHMSAPVIPVPSGRASPPATSGPLAERKPPGEDAGRPITFGPQGVGVSATIQGAVHTAPGRAEQLRVSDVSNPMRNDIAAGLGQPPRPSAGVPSSLPVTGPGRTPERIAGEERNADFDPAMTFGVLRREAHLQPLPQPSQQLADAIGAAIVRSGDASVAPLPNAELPPSGPGARPPLNILHVALQPADLGNVTVRLRLAGDVLEVRVVAERKDTADLLRHDRDQLTKLLASHGYDVTSLSIEIGKAETPAAPQAAPQMQAQPQQQQHAQPQSQAGSQQGPGGGQGERAPHGRSPEPSLANVPQENRLDEEPDRARRGGGDVYV